jgi:bisphosphoglycerate-independent phosphoglycerate mutase (AlkP superfamily)
MADKLRTKKEIKAKIAEEKKERKTLPERSMFGDNNWERIDANLEVLEWALKEYDLDEIKEALEREYSNWDESDPDFDDSDYEDMRNAVQPYQWLIGEIDEF